MARNTDRSLRNQVMYCVFVRNYSPEGTFDRVRQDLPRIRALGTDILWLMPIHPIGEANRKGILGSPYAIRDYRAVNPEYGTLEDFIALTEAARENGMKVIIDVVYNHTSPDSWLRVHHPEWFYHRPDGSFGNHVGDWTDIIDLDYGHKPLWEYQIDTLKQWAEWVDGFRCDVAPLVPLDFWRKARQEVEKVRPGCLWLAESVEPSFIRAIRAMGLPAASDGELYRAFDITYDYDIYDRYRDERTGTGTLEAFAAALDGQEGIYPENYVKLHALENHDRLRAAALTPDPAALRNWTALTFFAKGIPLIYNGQEHACTARPGLFDRDPVRWGEGQDLSALLARLSGIRRAPLFASGAFSVRAQGEILCAEHRRDKERMLGFFCTWGRGGCVRCDLPDGDYTDLLGGGTVRADQGLLPLKGEPVILKI